MKIMYVTSECAPFIKTGGLGDVAGSLPQALAAKGHDVRVFCPLYSAIDQSMREKFYYIKNAYVRLGWRNQYCGIFRYEADGVTYYFIDNEYYFARGQIYGEYDDAERFAYYSKAVLEVLPDLEWKPDVINCNDWQTALVPVTRTSRPCSLSTTSSTRAATVVRFWSMCSALTMHTSAPALWQWTATST